MGSQRVGHNWATELNWFGFGVILDFSFPHTLIRSISKFSSISRIRQWLASCHHSGQIPIVAHLVNMLPPYWPSCLCLSCSVMSNSLWPHGLHSLPGSSVHGILQAELLECVAISFSRGSSPPRDWTWLSRIAGRFFTVWATREALCLITICLYSVNIGVDPFEFEFDTSVLCSIALVTAKVPDWLSRLFHPELLLHLYCPLPFPTSLTQHWPLCSSLNIPGTFLPLWFSTCSSAWNVLLRDRHLHTLLHYLIHSWGPVSLSHRGLPCLFCLKSHCHLPPFLTFLLLPCFIFPRST